MTSLAAMLPASGTRRPLFVVGRPFVSPLFDYLLIASAWSPLFIAFLRYHGSVSDPTILAWLPALALISSSAHVAASTVRLYTKPDGFREFRFLTMGLPLAMVLVLTLSIAFAHDLGRHIQALYLTWNPYHYAAQAYGLAVMYCYRSGCPVNDADKRLMRTTCMAPFVFAFLSQRTVGVEWLVPASVLADPLVGQLRAFAARGALALTFALPLILFIRLALYRKLAVPAISIVIILANGIWWTTLTYMRAFFWGTVFHGVQYLAIVTIFHVKDQLQLPNNRHGWQRHAAGFYLLCVAVAFALFQCLPLAYVLLGFGLAESMLMVTAVLSIHHIFVDAFIWKLRKAPNYRIVTAASLAT